MSLEPLRRLHSPTLVLADSNLDTDQIIPARFLTTTERAGLGAHLFHDRRQDPAFPLNRPDAKAAQILVAGDNFGCGSSREHAPWALLDFGFKAVVAARIADIFKGNALKNGLLPVEVPGEIAAWLIAHPGAEIAIDVEACTLRLPDGRPCPFALDRFARRCLLDGVDELGFLMAHQDAIAAYEHRTA